MLKSVAVVACLMTGGSLACGSASAAPFGDPGHISGIQSNQLIEQARLRGRPGAHRPGRPVHVTVVRPRVYVNRPYRGRYWRPGVGWAVGTVVAVGFLSAAAATAYAPPAPSPGLCWYYSDPTYRAGYWAQCGQ